MATEDLPEWLRPVIQRWDRVIETVPHHDDDTEDYYVAAYFRCRSDVLRAFEDHSA